MSDKKDISRFTKEYKKDSVKKMQKSIEQNKIESMNWWKNLTPIEKKEYLEDVSKLCDIEI
ncbi:MAG: hypothetical protein H7A23_16795 [Leptospiraceae bacterium]|nr:hypothetical protein [Leptospiraceae bacterium]